MTQECLKLVKDNPNNPETLNMFYKDMNDLIDKYRAKLSCSDETGDHTLLMVATGTAKTKYEKRKRGFYEPKNPEAGYEAIVPLIVPNVLAYEAILPMIV